MPLEVYGKKFKSEVRSLPTHLEIANKPWTSQKGQHLDIHVRCVLLHLCHQFHELELYNSKGAERSQSWSKETSSGGGWFPNQEPEEEDPNWRTTPKLINFWGCKNNPQNRLIFGVVLVWGSFSSRFLVWKPPNKRKKETKKTPQGGVSFDQSWRALLGKTPGPIVPCLS